MPSGISRVSESLNSYTLLARLRQNSLRLFQEQQRLASGRQLLSISDDPIGASKITRLSRELDSQQQILDNIRHGDAQLSAADAALTDLGDLLIEAARIASEQAGSLQSADERASQVQVLDGLINQLLAVGNRQLQGDYLFGGRSTDTAPLSTALGLISYVGDAGSRWTTIDPGVTAAFNIAAGDVFNLRANQVGPNVDFDVQLTTGTRISELGGTLDLGVRLGIINVSQGGPAVNFQVDFTGAETVGDLIARFNDAAATAGSALTLGLSAADGGALAIASGPGVTINVTDVGSGTTALDLGIRKSAAAGVDLEGDSVKRRVALTTAIADLAPGGLGLGAGVQITNGTRSATVSFAGATSVQDLLNLLNGAGVGIRVAISDDGTGFTVDNLIAGSPLVIGENGGTDAASLGLKTLDASALVSRLNYRRGIHPVTGSDLRITNANGIGFDVDLSGAATVGDILNAINTASIAAGAGITAQINSSGGGLRLTGPAGAGTIQVQSLNLSPVAGELGLSAAGSATLLEGQDVAPLYQSGVFSALYRLRDGLLADNSSEITEAGAEINAVQTHVTAVAGQVGARARAIRAKLTQTEDAVTATQVLLSGVKDLDYTEAVTRFQQAQTALQASLLAGSSNQNLSLLDFLR